MSRAFFAYASGPDVVGETIEHAVEGFNEQQSEIIVHTWKALDIPGKFIASEIWSAIDASDYVIADISTLNFNVTYEVGYAIGKNKPVLLVRNGSIDSGGRIFDKLGIYDTLGYVSYINSTDLKIKLSTLSDKIALEIQNEKNITNPVFAMDAKYKTDWIVKIFSRLKKAKVHYRSYDPDEHSGLSAKVAFNEVSSSYGVLIPLLDKSIKDSDIHNVRAAFIAGLADGMQVHKLLLQNGEFPIPLDVRDFVAEAKHPKVIHELVAAFCAEVVDQLQQTKKIEIEKDETFLQRLELGSSSAENEVPELDYYYLDTDAFRRAERGEVRLVVGRKGSGKSAIFFQVRRKKWNSKNIILDLKPDGYKLRKFKEKVLILLQEGSAEHTVMAFWEYLLLLEIAHKIIESDKKIYMRDPELYEPYQKVLDVYDHKNDDEGDFTERMSALLDRIVNDYDQAYGESPDRSLTAPQVTELIFQHDIDKLRTAIKQYMSHKEELWLLFDNLDKGWPTHGIDNRDILMIRTLLEATRKLERTLQKRNVEVHSIVFLRNDVYELLIEETSDRGKETKVILDWTDKDMLREMLRRRLLFNDLDSALDFYDIWRKIFPSLIDGEESSEYLIERSLMRPRYLIDLVNHCKSFAVNLNHERIDANDIVKGLNAYSNDLLADISLEIRDVFPQAEDVIYSFISSQKTFNENDLRSMISNTGYPEEIINDIVNILIWYGVLGVNLPTGETKYIYDFNYNKSIVEGVIKKLAAAVSLRYSINPAFWPVLGVG